MEERFRVVSGGATSATWPAQDPELCQALWAEEFVATKTLRGFSQSTVESAVGLLDRVLELCDRFVWELEPGDIDRFMLALVARGVGPATRRNYLGTLLGFHRFLGTRKAVEIEQRFGVRVTEPTDEFNVAHHVGFESAAVPPPPTVERLERFFGFLRDRVATARKYAPAARDYALFQTLYLAGLRAEEAVSLEVGDVHFSRGPFGKLHVRFGKGARTSGPRPRWVPMLDGLDRILRWFIDDVRPCFPPGPALLCEQSGGPLSSSTVRNRLSHLLDLEGATGTDRFSPHALRRACATHNYERGVDLVAIQQMLGHWHVGTTMKYVLPSATFIENSYRRAIADTLSELQQEDRDASEVAPADGGG